MLVRIMACDCGACIVWSTFGFRFEVGSRMMEGYRLTTHPQKRSSTSSRCIGDNLDRLDYLDRTGRAVMFEEVQSTAAEAIVTA
jgi:hypothetical protein